MSRSAPNDHAPNPASKFFEWSSEVGRFRNYDKEQKKKIDQPSPWSFVLLDQMATVRGWHEPSKSGIYSNEVRDTRSEVMLVRAHKGGTLAEGVYQQIKARAKEAGGRFTANIYCAYKVGDKLKIGAVQLRGLGLREWSKFVKENRKAVYEKAIKVSAGAKEKVGKNEAIIPAFSLMDLSEEMNKQAVLLDIELQEYLKAYLARTTVAKAEHTQQSEQHAADDPGFQQSYPDDAQESPEQPPDDDSNVPF